jgi:hypothetical protein
VPDGKIAGDLKRRVDRANRFKVIKVLDLDMQDPEHSPLPDRQEAEQDPADDQDGLRDFSPATVERRRAHGYDFARRQLGPWFVQKTPVLSAIASSDKLDYGKESAIK